MDYDKLKQDLNLYNDYMVKINKKCNNLSLFRLFAFLAAIILALLGYFDKSFIAVMASIGMIILFIYLVVRHGEYISTKSQLEKKSSVINKYIKRFEGNFSDFVDDGLDFLRKEDTMATDLDLVGKKSLFQFLNVANTYEGKGRLYNALVGENSDIGSLYDRSEAIKELSLNDDFAINFEILGLDDSKKKISNKDFHKDFSEAVKNTKKLSFIYRVLAVVLPVALVFSIVLSVLDIIPIYIIAIVLAFNLCISFLLDHVVNSNIGSAFRLNEEMNKYVYRMDSIATADFKSPYLIKIQDRLKNDNNFAKAQKGLLFIENLYNFRFNPAVHFALQGIVLYDLWLNIYFEAWSSKYGDKFDAWFETVEEMEFLLSLSTLRRVKKCCAFDLKKDKELSLDFKEMYHPLLADETVISNSLSLTNNSIIITGSNMSGKTTFLRTIAINLILAYTGAGVCAKSMSGSYMRIFTSMRVMDDVSNGISTFYAEILRIKSMIEYSKLDQPMICFIDEIFKGTNSADRIIGAQGVLANLQKDCCICFTSTHDFELCDIDGVTNYHFEEYYEDNSIRFDYKLKDGRCNTTNALKLLELAGIK